MLKFVYKFIDSEMKRCFQEGQKTKFRFQTAWKMWHLRDIHLPNCHHPSAKVIVTERDMSFNLLIFLDPEHRNTSDSEHNTFTAKKSRQLNRREKARSSCKNFQRIRGSGESEIVQRWKSFKHLNKHSKDSWHSPLNPNWESHRVADLSANTSGSGYGECECECDWLALALPWVASTRTPSCRSPHAVCVFECLE